jgi:hypothetical protein
MRQGASARHVLERNPATKALAQASAGPPLVASDTAVRSEITKGAPWVGIGGSSRPGTATGAPAGDVVRLSFLMSNLIR